MLRSLTLLAALLIAAAPAMAEEAITEDSVRAYYKESVDAYKLPFADYYKKSDETTADTFISMSKLTIEMPGQPPVEKMDRKNKAESLAAAQQGHAAMQTATLEYKLNSIKISEDGKSADVSDVMTIKGMAVPGAPADVAMDAAGFCNDRLTLSAAGVLQMSASSCNVRMGIVKRK